MSEERKDPSWWAGHHQWTGPSQGFAVQAKNGASYTLHRHPTRSFGWVLTTVMGAEPPERIFMDESDIGPLAKLFGMADETRNKEGL